MKNISILNWNFRKKILILIEHTPYKKRENKEHCNSYLILFLYEAIKALENAVLHDARNHRDGVYGMC